MHTLPALRQCNLVISSFCEVDGFDSLTPDAVSQLQATLSAMSGKFVRAPNAHGDDEIATYKENLRRLRECLVTFEQAALQRRFRIQQESHQLAGAVAWNSNRAAF